MQPDPFDTYPESQHEPLHRRLPDESLNQWRTHQAIHETITNIQNLTRECEWWAEHGPLSPQENKNTTVMLNTYIDESIEYLSKLKKGQRRLEDYEQ